jgi:putative ABC transport system substrate-binding protein
MRRRDFLRVLGTAIASWPLAVWPITARGQQTNRLPVVGVLGTTSAAAWEPSINALKRRLGELGWIEGRNIAIEYRWAEGRSDRYADLTSELLKLKADIIVTSGGAVRAAKEVTRSTPIVFAISTDPVGTGLVESLARPGSNATGLSTQAVDVTGKKIEVFRELVPGMRRLAIVFNASNRNLQAETSEVQSAAQAFGLYSETFSIQSRDDVAPTIEAIKGRFDGAYIQTDPLTITNRIQIITLALASRLPTMHSFREFVEAGGLVSYGPSYTDLFRRAGDFVDKILRGSNPAELPVQQPIKFDLIINATTAKALGINVPSTLLARADEVIE